MLLLPSLQTSRGIPLPHCTAALSTKDALPSQTRGRGWVQERGHRAWDTKPPTSVPWMCSHSDRSVLLPLTAQSCPCWPATGWTAWSIHPTFPLGFLYQDSVLLIHLLCLKTRSSWWQKLKKLSKNSGNSSRFYFLPSKITVDTDYSYEIKRRLLLGRKVMTNLVY